MNFGTMFIIPTYLCNYRCNYCSEFEKKGTISNVDGKFLDNISIYKNQIFNKEIVVEGGEPLISGVDFYKLLLEKIGPEFKLFIRSNMSLFKPDEWESLIKDKRVEFGTSFNFGSSRYDFSGKVYSEDDFDKDQTMYKSISGRYMNFVYTLVNDNSDDKYLDKLAELVRKYNVEFEINGCYKVGKGINCQIPLYKRFYAFNYMLKNHRDIVFNLMGINQLIKRYTVDQIRNTSISDIYIDENGVFFDKPEDGVIRFECMQCVANNFCNVLRPRLKKYIKLENPSYLDDFCKQTSTFIKIIIKLKGLIK